MSKQFEGKIKERIIGNNIVFKIEYMDGNEKLIIKSVPYSKENNKNTYKINDKIMFELTQKNKAKIIDDKLIEYDKHINVTSWVYFIMLSVAAVSRVLFKSAFISNLFIILFVILLVAEVGVFLYKYISNTFDLVKNGNKVKGKIVSKKETLAGDTGTHGFKYYFLFEVLYNDKIYKIRDTRSDFTESLNVGDEIEIVVYKNSAFWAKTIEEVRTEQNKRNSS